MTLVADLNAFFTEHGHCGDLDAGVEREMVWIACECGATMVRRVDNALELNARRRRPFRDSAVECTTGGLAHGVIEH